MNLKINYKNLLLSAVLFVVLAQIIHSLCAYLGMGYYLEPEYFGVWSKIMMPGPGPPPAEFFYYSLGFGFISAVIYIVVYGILKDSIPGKNAIGKGLIYGFLVIWLVGTVPGNLAMYLLINLPPGILVLWALENLIIALGGGYLIVRINK